MIKRKYLVFLSIILFLFIMSCGGDETTGPNDSFGDFTGFNFVHQEGLTFKINATNVNDIKYFQFFINIDNSKLTYSDYTSSIGDPFFTYFVWNNNAYNSYFPSIR